MERLALRWVRAQLLSPGDYFLAAPGRFCGLAMAIAALSRAHVVIAAQDWSTSPAAS
jgi:hypothetical protein